MTASPCDPAGDRAISHVKLVLHVRKLVNEGRLSSDDGCAVLDALRAALSKTGEDA